MKILKALKYFNIIFIIFFCFTIFTFIKSYFNSNNENELNRLKIEIKNTNADIENLMLQIEEKNRLNQRLLQESLLKDKDIQALIENIFRDITDEEIGLFKIANINSKADNGYVNLYEITTKLQFYKNKIITFENLQNDILNEINKKIITNSEIEIKIKDFLYDEKSDLLTISFLFRKKLNIRS
ncbi:hypothetical protein N5912_02555 [Arcobacter lacus]|uniref:hypothetical protein n=1 Tax=Arcobacter lacus TaxID=1912876 RepID=UPI0021BAF98B|nr:hypothetical protein [Arcobacter lacus]MCT7910700.1 hypothetical protein [Arcobacter lacus]